MSDITPAETQPSSGASTPRISSHQEADTRHLQVRSSCPIPNSRLESKDISDEGETFDEVEDEDEEEEITPEQLIPQYINLQTQIYYLHPASTAPISRKKGGKGRKSEKSPAGLSAEKNKELKRLQDRVGILTRDPLFDAKEADYVWGAERLRLEKEGWAKKQPIGKWVEKNPKLPKTLEASSLLDPEFNEQDNSDGGIALPLPPEPAPIPLDDEYDMDLGLIGGLFELPPTEETIVGQAKEEKISIWDFEEVGRSGGNFGKNKPKGKAGVNSMTVRKVIEEVCKSRYVTICLALFLSVVFN